jgi:hypothetical protein
VCVQINNNLHCYELSSELSSSTLEALPPNYAEQVRICDKSFCSFLDDILSKLVLTCLETALCFLSFIAHDSLKFLLSELEIPLFQN